MKSKDFAVALRDFSNVLRAAGAGGSESLQQLAALFEIAPTATVANIIKKLSASNLNLSNGNPSVHYPALVLAELGKFMAGCGKPAFVADAAAVEAFLNAHNSASIMGLLEAAQSALLKPVGVVRVVRNDLIEHYAHRLEEALGDEPGFVALFREISENPDLSTVETAEITKRFTGKSAASKGPAMKKIWARHHNLMTFRAKAESRDGRSAA
jgi:hypothetical protein